MAYLIDSSVVIDFERQETSISEFRSRLGNAPMALASITVSELLVGSLRSTVLAHRLRRQAFIESYLTSVLVLPFDLSVARRHAALTVELTTLGQMIAPHDLIIAATAIHHGLTLVTRDLRHFSRVTGLLLANHGGE